MPTAILYPDPTAPGGDVAYDCHGRTWTRTDPPGETCDECDGRAAWDRLVDPDAGWGADYHLCRDCVTVVHATPHDRVVETARRLLSEDWLPLAEYDRAAVLGEVMAFPPHLIPADADDEWAEELVAGVAVRHAA